MENEMPKMLLELICVLLYVCFSPSLGKLPSGFYCSFEEGDCGWMEGSAASRASPWRIGSLEYNHFPSVAGTLKYRMQKADSKKR